MPTSSIYLLIGLSLLLAVVLPRALSRVPVSPPMVLVGVGILIGRSPLTSGLDADPVTHRGVIEHVTELTVLLALMGVGLALDRPLTLRDRRSWARWSPAWRLLAVGMPITIGGVALIGWAALGVALPTAVLLGAALAPTDPVLASDVQVEGPRVAVGDEVELGIDGEVDEDDEVRFALTSEAGLNDGLAFPFVHLAILLAGVGSVATWGGYWLGWHLVLQIVLGVAVGVGVGRALAAVAFRSPRPALRLAEQGDPLLVVAALLTSYGLSELVGGYGFLATFTCAMTIRAADRSHGYHEAMHGVVERLERLLTLFVLLALGVAMTHGLLAALDARGIAIGLALVLVVRPVAGLVALRVRPRSLGEPGALTRSEALVTAFFGVRGIGSLYYLAYAAGHADFAQERWMWSVIAFTIAVSVIVHGVGATPAMHWLGHRRGPGPADTDLPADCGPPATGTTGA
ncbi:cation:proton antiporter [Dermatophilaceae bacterium Soc4.6]